MVAEGDIVVVGSVRLKLPHACHGSLPGRLIEWADAPHMEDAPHRHGQSVGGPALGALGAGPVGHVPIARRVDEHPGRDGEGTRLRLDDRMGHPVVIDDRVNEEGMVDNPDLRLANHTVGDDLQPLGVEGDAPLLHGPLPWRRLADLRHPDADLLGDASDDRVAAAAGPVPQNGPDQPRRRHAAQEALHLHEECLGPQARRREGGRQPPWASSDDADVDVVENPHLALGECDGAHGCLLPPVASGIHTRLTL